MSEYNIDDIKIGNHNIVKAYKGDDLIFDRNAEQFIQSTVQYGDQTHDPGYIYISDRNLYANYKYEVDAQFDTPDYYFSSFLGGENADAEADWSVQGTSPGLFFGSFAVTEYGWNRTGIPYDGDYGVGVFDIDNLMWPWDTTKFHPLSTNMVESLHTPDPLDFPIRRTITLYDPNATSNWTGVVPQDNPKRMTTNGFFLMGSRRKNGTVYNVQSGMMGSFNSDRGKVYRISIYDTNGTTLLMNFKPKIQNGHIGMIDTVSGTFYPCNDDTLFRIAKR